MLNKAITLSRAIKCFEFGKKDYPNIRQIKETTLFRWYAKGWLEKANEVTKVPLIRRNYVK